VGRGIRKQRHGEGADGKEGEGGGDRKEGRERLG